MKQSVDPDRIMDLSKELRRYRDRNMDALTQRLKELTMLVNETQYSYSEYYVQSAASEVQQLIGEIRSLMQSVDEQLSTQVGNLKKAAETYAEQEIQLTKKIEAEISQIQFQSIKSVGSALASLGQAGSSLLGNKKPTEEQEIQQDNMQGLLARFMVEKGYTAAEISTKLNSKEFEQYILGQGFDPETFQYIPLHERAHAYSKYNSDRDSQLNLSEEQLQHAISAMTDYLRWEDIRKQVNAERLGSLIGQYNSYLSDPNDKVSLNDVLRNALFNEEDPSFMAFAIDRGYHPETFEYLQPWEKSSVYMKYNSIMTDPDIVQQRLARNQIDEQRRAELVKMNENYTIDWITLDPEKVNTGNMRALLDSYNRNRPHDAWEVFEGEVYAEVSEGSILFRMYAYQQGYNPETFEYIPGHERQQASQTYNAAYFDGMIQYYETYMDTFMEGYETLAFARGIYLGMDHDITNKFNTAVETIQDPVGKAKEVYQGAKDTYHHVVGEIEKIKEDPLGYASNQVEKAKQSIDEFMELSPAKRWEAIGQVAGENAIDTVASAFVGGVGGTLIKGASKGIDIPGKKTEVVLQTAKDTQDEIRRRVLENIRKSQAAREASKFDEYLKSEKKLMDSIEERRALERTGKVQTGGRELSVDEYLKRLDTADAMYESFRKSNVDVQNIAKNTGMPENRVQRIKDHLFFKEHIKEHGVGRFEADYEIAQAWDRLQKGTFKQQDIDLLNHELFESKFEGIFKTDYRTAHDRTVDSGRPWYPPEEE